MLQASPVGQVVSVNVGATQKHTWNGPRRRTAIVKGPVQGPVEVGVDGLVGDERADATHHGGPYHAIYAYSVEDYAWWAAELGRDLPPGLFGENLTVAGLDLVAMPLGTRWHLGTAVLEACGPRIPCQTFARRMQEPQWTKRFTRRGATGTYLRVLQVGVVALGDAITVEEVSASANPQFITVGQAFRARTTARADLPLLADVEALRPDVRAEARAASPPASIPRASIPRASIPPASIPRVAPPDSIDSH